MRFRITLGPTITNNCTESKGGRVFTLAIQPYINPDDPSRLWHLNRILEQIARRWSNFITDNHPPRKKLQTGSRTNSRTRQHSLSAPGQLTDQECKDNIALPSNTAPQHDNTSIVSIATARDPFAKQNKIPKRLEIPEGDARCIWQICLACIYHLFPSSAISKVSIPSLELKPPSSLCISNCPPSYLINYQRFTSCPTRKCQFRSPENTRFQGNAHEKQALPVQLSTRRSTCQNRSSLPASNQSASRPTYTNAAVKIWWPAQDLEHFLNSYSSRKTWGICPFFDRQGLVIPAKEYQKGWRECSRFCANHHILKIDSDKPRMKIMMMQEVL